PTVHTTLRSLGALYRCQGKLEAAETLEECATKSRKPKTESSHQTRIVELLKEGGLESQAPRQQQAGTSGADNYTVNRSEGEDTAVASEWKGDGNGSLQRSGSLGKIRDALLRKSGMLVKKLQGSSPQEPRNPGMKRASSLNFLNKSGVETLEQSRSSLAESKTLSASNVDLSRRSSLSSLN
ncbi:kinesin light chain 2-like, partial [Stegostoma tigrinum]|uniref:kinesin light chain 2-like n=1 Tax=Stegostoma tigrinum TaxID=3053191 RepID=UPI00202B2383